MGMLCYARLRNATLCYARLCYATLYCAMLGYATLCLRCGRLPSEERKHLIGVAPGSCFKLRTSKQPEDNFSPTCGRLVKTYSKPVPNLTYSKPGQTCKH